MYLAFQRLRREAKAINFISLCESLTGLKKSPQTVLTLLWKMVYFNKIYVFSVGRSVGCCNCRLIAKKWIDQKKTKVNSWFLNYMLSPILNLHTPLGWKWRKENTKRYSLSRQNIYLDSNMFICLVIVLIFENQKVTNWLCS